MIDVGDVVEFGVNDGLVKSSDIGEVDDIDLVVRGNGKSIGLLGVPLDGAQRLNGVYSGTNT